MLHLSTTDTIHGKKIEQSIGIVRGSCIRSRFFIFDMFAFIQTLLGSELNGYTQSIVESRNIAEQRMIQKALNLKADGIIAVRFTNSITIGGSIETMVYGTAVKFKI